MFKSIVLTSSAILLLAAGCLFMSASRQRPPFKTLNGKMPVSASYTDQVARSRRANNIVNETYYSFQADWQRFSSDFEKELQLRGYKAEHKDSCNFYIAGR